MSTKIYNGWLMDAKTLERAFEDLCEVVRPAFERAALRRLKQLFPDAFTPHKQHTDGRFRFDVHAVGDLCRQAAASNFRAHSNLDFKAQVVLIPAHTGPRRILAMTFWEQNVYDLAWARSKAATEFGYWNNTERPERVTDAEWKLREKLWSRIMVPAKDGLTVELMSGDVTGMLIEHVFPS